MMPDSTRPIGPAPDPQIDPLRLFVHEPGWRVALKIGSVREFCYAMEPGKDYYHRLHDGELYLYHGGERLCLACAARRGLLSPEPRRLGEPLLSAAARSLPGSSEYDLIEPDDRDDPDS